MTTIGLSALTVIGLLLAQGFLLQLAVAITGEPAPRLGRATRIALVGLVLGFVGTTAWGFTVGLFLGKALTATVSGLLWIGASTVVYRRSLNLSLLHALFVALIQSSASAVVSSIAYAVIRAFG
ncbi:MAG: hypothetical protein ABMA64_41365 [Myxococcota bacterium]